MDAITSPQPTITGVPDLRVVNLDALFVIYPANSLDFFISGNKLIYFLCILKKFKWNVLYFFRHLVFLSNDLKVSLVHLIFQMF